MLHTTTKKVLGALAAAALLLPLGASTTNAAPSADSMIPTDVTRIVDSRQGIGVPRTLRDGDTATIQITGSLKTTDGTETVVPPGADAVVVNLTAANVTRNGYFVAWASGQEKPATSNLNFVKGDVIANGATIALGGGGAIDVFTRGSADILIDVAGYYEDGDFTAIRPRRAYDSRDTALNGLASGETSVNGGAVTKVKVADKAGELVTVNLTSTNAQSPGYATVWSSGDSQPATSNLNYAPGRIVSNTALVRSGAGGYVDIYTMSRTALIVDVLAVSSPTQVTLLPSAQRVVDERTTIPEPPQGKRTLKWQGDVPSDLGSIILNVTVDNAQAHGYVSMGASLADGPQSTSVLNYKKGEVASNRVVIPASAAGTIDVYTMSNAHVIVDVLGYTPAPIEAANCGVDLSRSGDLVLNAPPIDKKLQPNTAIALYNEAGEFGDDKLVYDGSSDKDSTRGDRLWTPAGKASFLNSSGVVKTVSVVKGNDWSGDKVAEDLLVPLEGLADGTYTLSVPMQSNAAVPQRATYTTEFTVSKSRGIGADFGVISVYQPFSWTSDGSYNGTNTTYTVDNQRSKSVEFTSGPNNADKDMAAAFPTRTTSDYRYQVLDEAWNENGQMAVIKEALDGETLSSTAQKVSIRVSNTGSDKVKITYSSSDAVKYYAPSEGFATDGDDMFYPQAPIVSASGVTSECFGADQKFSIMVPETFTGTTVKYAVVGYADELDQKIYASGTATRIGNMLRIPPLTSKQRAAIEKSGDPLVMMTLAATGGAHDEFTSFAISTEEPTPEPEPTPSPASSAKPAGGPNGQARDGDDR